MRPGGCQPPGRLPRDLKLSQEVFDHQAASSALKILQTLKRITWRCCPPGRRGQSIPEGVQSLADVNVRGDHGSDVRRRQPPGNSKTYCWEALATQHNKKTYFQEALRHPSSGHAENKNSGALPCGRPPKQSSGT